MAGSSPQDGGPKKSDGGKDWRRDEIDPAKSGQLGAEGDSDDVADSPAKGHGARPTPAKGDTDDLEDDR